MKIEDVKIGMRVKTLGGREGVLESPHCGFGVGCPYFFVRFPGEEKPKMFHIEHLTPLRAEAAACRTSNDGKLRMDGKVIGTITGFTVTHSADVPKVGDTVIITWGRYAGQRGRVVSVTDTMAAVKTKTAFGSYYLDDIEVVKGEDSSMATEAFWMVYGMGQGAPAVRHASRVLAEAEASRLARNNPGIAFYVMSPVTKVQKEDVKIERLDGAALDFGRW